MTMMALTNGAPSSLRELIGDFLRPGRRATEEAIAEGLAEIELIFDERRKDPPPASVTEAAVADLSRTLGQLRTRVLSNDLDVAGRREAILALKEEIEIIEAETGEIQNAIDAYEGACARLAAPAAEPAPRRVSHSRRSART